jgi:hypothetical protein
MNNSENVNVLLKEPYKYILSGVELILVFVFMYILLERYFEPIFPMAVNEIKKAETRTDYYLNSSETPILVEINSGSTWILKKCDAPAGSCWQPLNRVSVKK